MTDLRHKFNLSKEAGLLSFVLLLIVILNVVVVGDLFLSILHSPHTLRIVRMIIMLFILGFLGVHSARNPEIQSRGWVYIILGFSLVFLDALLGVAADSPLLMDKLSDFGMVLFTFMTTFFFQLLGYFCLAYGFFLWIPAMIQARRSIEQTAMELEHKVMESTLELRESYEELRESKLQLEEATKIKNEFLASVSHELKTPLNSIMGFCRLLLEERHGPLTEKQRKSLQLIDSNSHNLFEQIRKLLDFSKLEFNDVQVRFERVRLEDVMQEAMAVVEPLAREKNLLLEVEAGEDAEYVFTDRKVLGQLLLAILDNAIKFTDTGSIRILSGSVDAGYSSWWVAISDSGIGIPDEDRELIFDPFRQVDGSLRRRHRGTGLGLSIARKLVLLLGGSIEVESIKEVGSTFTMTFPNQNDFVVEKQLERK